MEDKAVRQRKKALSSSSTHNNTPSNSSPRSSAQSGGGLSLIKVILFVLVGLVGVVFAFHTYGRLVADVEQAAKATGQLYNIEHYGQKLYAHCTRVSSKYTVVIDTAGDDTAFEWSAVQKQLAKEGIRSCAFDRTGRGFSHSDPLNHPRTVLRRTDESRSLFEALEIETPIIYVGSFIGGFDATVYAQRFPEQVKGLVLINPHEPILAAHSLFAPTYEALASNARLFNILGYLGVSRLLVLAQKHPYVQNIKGHVAEEDLPFITTTYSNPETYKYFAAELESLTLDAEYRNGLPRLSEDLPVVIISSHEDSKDKKRIADAAYNERVKQSRFGRYIESKVPQKVHLQDPQAVVDNVKYIINSIDIVL